MRQIQIHVKHVLDFVLALLLAVPVSIFILFLGVILYIDSPGPIFFTQPRLGRREKIFRIIKLRTMTPGDHTNRTNRNPDGSLSLSGDSGSLTRVGVWLRRTSLDEIPQIFNILKGEMSFVGPRPDLPEHVGLYSDEERLKLLVRPGLTGLAQVMGRNDLPWPDRLKLDVRYVREFSLWLDLRILFRTVPLVITRKGVFQR